MGIENIIQVNMFKLHDTPISYMPHPDLSNFFYHVTTQ